MAQNPYAPVEIDISTAKPRLRYWFLAGFLLVLVTMALTMTQYTWTPSGNGIMSCKLWKYYEIELSRALSGNKALGPSSGSTNAATIVALEHLLFSGARGLIAVGIGWAVGKYRRQKTD